MGKESHFIPPVLGGVSWQRSRLDPCGSHVGLTARPWPARSKGLLNPPGGAAAPTRSREGDAVAHWWTEAGAPGADWRRRWRARHSPGRGGRPHATLGPPLAQGLGGSEMGISDPFATGEEGPGPGVGWNRASSHDKITSRAALPSAGASLTLETPSGESGRPERDAPRAPGNPREDSPCPTCSSSSESEPEGFFFGQRLPGPWETPGHLRAGDGGMSRKHCTVC